MLRKEIDKKTKSVTLIYGGRKITQPEMDTMKSKLKNYGLEGTTLEIKQGFAIFDYIKTNKEFTQVATAMEGMEADLRMLREKLDSLTAKDSVKKRYYYIRYTFQSLQ